MSFHGSRLNCLNLISKGTGFKASASRRSLHGRGVYTSKYVGEALRYAEPHREENGEMPCTKDEWFQTILVCALFKGNTAVGRENQCVFGKDESGSFINTLTNKDETIFCANHESQLYPLYEIRMRYCKENVCTEQDMNVTGFLNSSLQHLIKRRYLQAQNDQQSAGAITSAASSATRTGTTSIPWNQVYSDNRNNFNFTFQNNHRTNASGFYLGDKVMIMSRPFNYYDFCVHKIGTIKAIIKKYNCMFFVELDDPIWRAQVLRLNKLQTSSQQNYHDLNGIQKNTLRCTVGQISKRTNSNQMP
jgi:hypothetical protein